MGSRLLNVRLDETRLMKARRLRETGVTLADVVRQAIDARYEALGLGAVRDPAAAVTRIHQRYPDPADLPNRQYDVHDRRAAAAAITRAVKRKAR